MFSLFKLTALQVDLKKTSSLSGFFFFFWQNSVAKSNVSDLWRDLFSKSASRQVATVKVDSLAVIKILSTKA